MADEDDDEEFEPLELVPVPVFNAHDPLPAAFRSFASSSGREAAAIGPVAENQMCS